MLSGCTQCVPPEAGRIFRETMPACTAPRWPPSSASEKSRHAPPQWPNGSYGSKAERLRRVCRACLPSGSSRRRHEPGKQTRGRETGSRVLTVLRAVKNTNTQSFDLRQLTRQRSHRGRNRRWGVGLSRDAILRLSQRVRLSAVAFWRHAGRRRPGGLDAVRQGLGRFYRAHTS